MKRFLIAAAAVTTIAAATASPAFAVQVWQGDMFLTDANAACKAKGFTVDDFFRGVYRPAGVADNGANSFLSLTGSRNSQRFSAKWVSERSSTSMIWPDLSLYSPSP